MSEESCCRHILCEDSLEQMVVVEVQAKISFFHLHYTEGKLDSFRYLKIVLKDAKERRTGSGTKYAGPRAKPRKFAEGF